MKTKGAVKNGHSRDTGDIGHTRQRQTNKKTKHNKSQKTKKMSNMYPPKLVVNPGAHEGYTV
jgi:hypothetical protein